MAGLCELFYIATCNQRNSLSAGISSVKSGRDLAMNGHLVT